MFKPYPLFVGSRYTAARQRSQLVSFISALAMLGMVIGVALLILVLSVMNGFEKELRGRILGLVPQIVVMSLDAAPDWSAVREQVEQHPDVLATAPYVQLNGLLVNGPRAETALVFGIDAEAESKVSIIERFLSPELLVQLGESDHHIVLGSALAKRLRVAAGDSVSLMLANDGTGGVGGELRPALKRFSVLAVLETGTEIDQELVLIAYPVALAMSGDNAASQGLRVKVVDAWLAPRVGWELSQSLPEAYLARDWTRTHGNLYSAIALSRQLVGLMLLTVIAVAAFNVIAALVMVVTDKRSDIAILRTHGASRGGVLLIFLVQGSLIGLVGIALGAALGAGLSLVVTDGVAGLELLLNRQFLNSDVYPVSYLPADLRWSDVLMVSATALVMSTLATLYPAWRASRVQPAEALRYD